MLGTTLHVTLNTTQNCCRTAWRTLQGSLLFLYSTKQPVVGD